MRHPYNAIGMTPEQEVQSRLAERLCAREFEGTLCDGRIKLVMDDVLGCEYCGIVLFKETRVG